MLSFMALSLGAELGLGWCALSNCIFCREDLGVLAIRSAQSTLTAHSLSQSVPHHSRTVAHAVVCGLNDDDLAPAVPGGWRLDE